MMTHYGARAQSSDRATQRLPADVREASLLRFAVGGAVVLLLVGMLLGRWLTERGPM